MISLDKNKPENKNININIDPNRTPILYADIAYIKSNENGVVLDFAQQVGPSDQFTVVARIGVSKEHAQKLINHLEALLRAEGTSTTHKTN